MDRIDAYLNAQAQLLQTMPRQAINQVVSILRQARKEGRCIFIFGNGGSAANASHFVNDMVKGTLDPAKPRVKMICLNDNIPTLTALANDMGYEHIFSEPLASLAQPGDIAIAISGSGNSPNVLRAVQVARLLKLTSIGISGATGGKLQRSRGCGRARALALHATGGRRPLHYPACHLCRVGGRMTHCARHAIFVGLVEE